MIKDKINLLLTNTKVVMISEPERSALLIPEHATGHDS
jgi:hypothetical protein